ncbi:MAG: hypothetical protein EBU92_04240, partial [Betaproteobacteria bacterium]|nr:hypothetical protein [Betaproteobacteria bacterium]
NCAIGNIRPAWMSTWAGSHSANSAASALPYKHCGIAFFQAIPHPEHSTRTVATAGVAGVIPLPKTKVPEQ